MTTHPEHPRTRTVTCYALSAAAQSCLLPRVLGELGSERAFVVHGHDGLDEISVCAPTRVAELKDKAVSTYDITPEQFFNEAAEPEELVGGAPEQNAEITKQILNGEKGPKRDVVLINAAAALVAAGQANDLKNGISLAENAIDTGSALAKLNALIAFTRENG